MTHCKLVLTLIAAAITAALAACGEQKPAPKAEAPKAPAPPPSIEIKIGVAAGCPFSTESERPWRTVSRVVPTT